MSAPLRIFQEATWVTGVDGIDIASYVLSIVGFPYWCNLISSAAALMLVAVIHIMIDNHHSLTTNP